MTTLLGDVAHLQAPNPTDPGTTAVQNHTPEPPGDLAALSGIGLAELEARAALQTRVDFKYLLSPPLYRRFLRRLAQSGEWGCLEIDGRRDFGYRSVYFDTPDLLTFRQHRQGRRRRFKIRTRSYLDTGTCVFEVKLRGAREATVKERIDHPEETAGRLTGPAREFLTDTLWQAYRLPVPPDLAPTARTDYRRHTLVHLHGGTRVTCDTGLLCSSPRRRLAAAEMVVVETKSAASGGAADRLLWSLGARPLRISKYCLAAATLTPGVTAGRWRRAQKLLFPGT